MAMPPMRVYPLCRIRHVARERPRESAVRPVRCGVRLSDWPAVKQEGAETDE